MQSKNKYSCSVITPVYNEEKNINKFLDVLGKVNSSSIQFIIIDDGSSDKTSSIIADYLQTHNAKGNIKFISKDNGGAADARLLGIKNADSVFIAFWDCDDVIEPGTIDRALQKFAEDSDIDFVLFDYYAINNGKKKRFDYSIKNWPVTGLIAFSNTIDAWGIHGFGVYRKETILSGYSIAQKFTKDKENNINDDELIARAAILSARKVTMSEGRYLYSDNILSTTRGINKNLYKMSSTAINLLHLIEQDSRTLDFIPAAHLYMLRVSTNLFLKKYRWRRQLNNISEWDASLKKLTHQIVFKNIYIETRKKPKLFFWSVAKFLVLKSVCG
ncbi:glycosyltransferase family 2 protein [Citrobacter freundii]|uniref:glycosyltransferase family 2 protein n=1 Tax=Citrobacter freundii TaxID=546 RepID=UPI00149560C8|nr:glycosyltransferase family 2 protein [Citrobacter freundii]MBJ9192147.1 glycosyltransferase family 2 protein [Citrobacter freundii]MBM3007814.1 glycosyltransferase family 2 protein [Citrobacter freundii]